MHGSLCSSRITGVVRVALLAAGSCWGSLVLAAVLVGLLRQAGVRQYRTEGELTHSPWQAGCCTRRCLVPMYPCSSRIPVAGTFSL